MEINGGVSTAKWMVNSRVLFCRVGLLVLQFVGLLYLSSILHMHVLKEHLSF